MKTTPRSILRVAMAVALFAVAGHCYADDVYFVEDLEDVKITEGELPNLRFWSYPSYAWGRYELPYAVVDGAGEAYAAGETRRDTVSWQRLAVRVPEGRKVTGRLYLGDKMVRFEIDAENGKASQREAFLKVKRSHYRRLVSAEIPGAAWFRHQRMEAERELGLNTDELDDADDRRFDPRGRRDASDTFSLATGGQALAENLQLDRVLPRSKTAPETVALDSIKGVTVREFDWTEYVKEKKPKLDTLAGAIPADQHAVFFPSFDALMSLADHADRFGTPVLRSAEPRSDDAKVQKRYERQLCLPTSALSRLLGPKLIDSVALTGGDPYLLMGSDVAILFEAKDRAVLTGIINARVALAGREYKTAEAVAGEIGGVKYHGMRSPDRAICSYVATVDNTVIVTNSLAQLERLVDVHNGKSPSLASLAEYTFFRDRYTLGDANESGLLILSDATIRRWCGPKWRIADSRRVRAAAVMSHLQARHLDRVVAKNAQPLAATSVYPLSDAGEFEINAGGVRSSAYGELDFMTPIGELDLTQVTKEEARLYGLWRDGYQRNWSRYFDPIAVRFFVSKDKLAVDTTVMPLIDGTEYAEFIDIARGAKLAATAGDPHAEAAFHWAMAIDPDSETMRRYSQFLPPLGGAVKVDALSWVGSSVSIYADRDPFWQELTDAEDTSRFLSANVHRLPVALRVEVRDGLKLTLFLTALRGFIEQTSPGMVTWEAKEHEGTSYVRVAPTKASAAMIGEDGLKKLALYYVPSAEALTVTLREDLLHRAIDRQTARDKAKAAEADKEGETDAPSAEGTEQPPFVAKPWLGDHFCVRIDRSALQILDGAFSDSQQQQMQRLAWANLPILNEWRRLYPAEDAVDLHERLWHRRLVCPGGGEYGWNEKWQTYESTVYGHPGEPKTGPTLAAGLRDIQSGDFGLTFEPDGLRARVEVLRTDAANEQK